MKRILCLCLALFGLAAGQPADEYVQGNAAYQAGDYQKAAVHYQSAAAAGYQAFELYYNLGNCYYKLQQIGKSLLYYEKAARINPTDPDLQYNLELARLHVVDKIITPPEFFWQRIGGRIKSALSLDQLAGFLLLWIVLAALAMIGKWCGTRDPWRRLTGYLWMPLGILTALWALFFIVRVNQSSHDRAAIIMEHKVSVLSAPADNSTEVFALHEGCKVRLEEKSGGYVRISLPDGKVGWAPITGLQEI